MNLLLDTHIALWALTDSPRLSRRARELIADVRNQPHVSDVSAWEVALKHVARPEGMPLTAERFIQRCRESGYRFLPLTQEAIVAYERAFAERGDSPHKDPFDRMLVAQAKQETMVLLTHDRTLGVYEEPLVVIV